MKRAVLGILGLLALAVIVVLGLATTKPDTFRVERKGAINAPAEAVFPHLENFHDWATWSPWEHLDPNMKKTFGGPEKGVGASYGWEGNKDAGKGKMTIVESEPPKSLRIQLQFIDPFPADNEAAFALTPQGTGTEVSWVISGPMSFMSKIICVFADMDTLIGGDLERGLANLKRTSETNGPKAEP